MNFSAAIGILLAVLVFVAASLLPRVGLHRDAYNQVCTLVEEKFYRSDDNLKQWVKSCRDGTRDISLWWDHEQLLREVQYRLDEFEVSHLMVYDPQADRRIWKGEAKDTGLRAYRIEDQFVVGKVLPGSVALQADIRLGDEVLEIDGEPVRSQWQIQIASGTYLMRRGENTFEVLLEPTSLNVDRKPEVFPISPTVAQLEISSFRAEYFKAETWREVVNQFLNFKRVVVDLRDNSGGNIVAMLRALSPFFCRSEVVGVLSQPRRSVKTESPPPDDLDDLAQLKYLEKFREAPLATFPDYGCYKGEVVVLINQDTASVSEIFAQAMLDHGRAKIWGRPSAGDVLIATWYALPMLGAGYSLSIPEALFLTRNQDSLEGGGVWPQRELSYDLKDALQGKDSWLLRAAE